MKRLFDDVPLVCRVVMQGRPQTLVMNHWSISSQDRVRRQSTSSPKSLTTRCAP
jgi:hypothetical protein